MSELQDIIALIADQMRCREDRIHPSTTLADDLGMDGDDAVEFFEKFAQEFPGDYSGLARHWHRHFGPEGVLMNFPSALFVVPALGVVAGFAVHAWIRWVPTWLASGALAIAGVALYAKIHALLRPSTDPARRPITVQNLVDAAESRKWPLEYSSEEDALPSYYPYPSVVPPPE